MSYKINLAKYECDCFFVTLHIVLTYFPKTMKYGIISIITMIFFAFGLQSCADSSATNSDEKDIELAMHLFVQTLDSGIDTSSISLKVKQYLETKDSRFFGSTVCVLNEKGKAVFSPYWYRKSGGLAYVDLAADPSYGINEQEWLTKPLQSGSGIWSNPYFDAGGGEIWMKTYSLPIRVNGTIVAVATTDLQVPAP